MLAASIAWGTLLGAFLVCAAWAGVALVALVLAAGDGEE